MASKSDFVGRAKKGNIVNISDGTIRIDVEELVSRDDFLTEAAKHATFNRFLVKGVIQLMLTDEAQWDENEIDTPWWTSVSFGRSYFEEARALLIAKADEASRKQVELYQKERDTYEKYYHEYQSKSCVLESKVRDLQYALREARHEIEVLRATDA